MPVKHKKRFPCIKTEYKQNLMGKLNNTRTGTVGWKVEWSPPWPI